MRIFGQFFGSSDKHTIEMKNFRLKNVNKFLLLIAVGLFQLWGLGLEPHPLPPVTHVLHRILK